MAINLIEPSVQNIENLELFLLNLRYREGQLINVEGNNPILLNDPKSVWVVFSGIVDVFVVPVEDGEVVGTRNYLFHSTVGQMLAGVHDAKNSGLGILVSGTPGTRLLKMNRSKLQAMAADLEVNEFIFAMLDDWVTALSMGISSSVVPKNYVLLKAGEDTAVDESQVVLPHKGILWVRSLKSNTEFLNEPSLNFSANGHYLPLSKFTWLRSQNENELQALDTEAYVQNDEKWASLDEFHQLVLDSIALNRKQKTASERDRLLEKLAAEQAMMERALQQLRTPLGGDEETAFIDVIDTQNSLLAASQLVGKALGIQIPNNIKFTADQTLGELFQEIANLARVRTREVSLLEHWWDQDNGPILAFFEENQRAVALLQNKPGRYELHDPIAKQIVPVDESVAAKLLPYGFSFYRPFPAKALDARELLRFGLRGAGYDLRTILILGALTGLLGLLPPIVTGFIFNEAIPTGSVGVLVQIAVALIAITFAGGFFKFTRGLSLLRIQTNLDVSVQAALWDRLLSLPIPFFREYTSGDLATRAMGISTIRRMVSGYMIESILTSIFSVFNLVLLFFYSAQLALVALGLVLVSIIVTFSISRIFLSHQREFFDVQGRVSGTVLQILTGIVKFRVAGAESQAFSLWADVFSEQKRLAHHGRILSSYLRAFTAAYPLIATLVLFGVVAYSENLELSTGDFLAFFAAFVQFLSVWFILGTILIQALAAVPIYERLKPILETEPEIQAGKIDPGTLTGEIEVSHVSFRYRDDAPIVLKDISLSIKAGEFAAFVGPSGSGKSTMLRLLLGFEKPESGGIYYDQQDLDDMDIRKVRKQIGVVLQNATLMSGDIRANIVGSSPDLSVEDAWEAARMAGLDEDIREMPMGMHTVVSERGGTFSGGQRQRLMIARALVTRPFILYFDEATSALDNRTQEIVSQSLEGLQATRVVIAHRLSTIINADKIFVFDNGQIVQAGTYGELIKEEGPFAELARRQVL